MWQLNNLIMVTLSIFILLVNVSNRIAHAQSIIKIDGSSTVYPITKAVAEKFKISQKSTVKVAVNISGSGGGFKKFCRDEIDITNASRPILRNEMADCKEGSVQYIEIPIAFDALTVAVNPQNNWSTAMTTLELKRMWEPASQGKITKWNQINSQWPNETFQLYGADSDSGTFDYFTKAVIGKTKSSRSDFMESENDNVLVESVASNKFGLGFFGFAYYIENQDKVKAVAINNGNGAISPSVEAVENGTYQPLSRPIFIYVNAKAASKEEVKEFIEFYLKNALLMVKEAKFIPLPPRAYRIMLEHFNRKRVGTVFDGVSAVGLTIDDLIRREGRLEYDNY